MDELKRAENMVLVALPDDSTPTEQEIHRLVAATGGALGLSETELDILEKHIHARVAVRMDVGVSLIDADFRPWLSARKPEIDPFFWNRFSVLLRKKTWPPAVVNTLDRVTDDILDLLGDPRKSGEWMRRGLVMGGVQSGKTSTYTALCCKAADAGYRLIVLLTGTLENLRRQTQERLDEGFVGLDSSGILTKERKIKLSPSRRVGVGLIDERRSAGVFTSRSRDFSRNIVTSLGFRLDAFNEPVLVVLKKNKRILENLSDWLGEMNARDGRIDTPMLLIDDEADNASVNTKAEGYDPTAINDRIRTLLRLFTRSSYVGFTATPFANVFIDPESESEMLGHDLFPRHFIYCLAPPSNYVGPDVLFGSEERHESIRTPEGADQAFPPKHTASHSVSGLPSSLQEAIRVFFLATTIRDLRREGPTHRSMLVNVSRFTDVQNQVARFIDEEVRQIQQDIRNFSQLPVAEALRNPSLSEIHDTWQREFRDAGFEWAEVQPALLRGVVPVVVQAVNQRTGAASLDYKIHKETGLRVIAVGGNSLSRGLTLEGLSTSYFYRNSQMYDTLLQMGRWFGYRDGYEDLCRLWITEEAAQWYAHITLATEELRLELLDMRQNGMTPSDFGLKVRAHPDSLIVTARNKMRHAHTIERLVSFSGEGPETPRLRRDENIILSNARAAEEFINSLGAIGCKPRTSPWGSTLWSGVPKGHVSRLLRRFENHPLHVIFQPAELASFLDNTTEKKLELWDVAVPEGKAPEPRIVAGHTFHPIKRNVEVNPSLDSIMVSGSSSRVGSRGIEREGLPLEIAEQALDRYRALNPGKAIPDREYRKLRERPLLLIYYISPAQKDRATGDIPEPLVALGLSFPTFNDRDTSTRVRYTVNLVEWNQRFSVEVDDDEVEEDDTGMMIS